jgi:hypothetical protein
MKLTPVTDPSVLKELETAPKLKRVTDPATLRALEGGTGKPPANWVPPKNDPYLKPPAKIGPSGEYLYDADNPPHDDNAFVAERQTVGGVEYQRNRTNGIITGPDGRAVDDPQVLQAFGKTRPTKAAQRALDAEAPATGEYFDEFGRSLARGAANTVGGALKGAALAQTADPATVAEIETGIADVRSMPYEQAEAFRQSIKDRVKAMNLNPLAAVNYEAALRAKWRGDDATAERYLATARSYAQTGAVKDQPLYEAGQSLTEAVAEDFPQDPRFKDSWTSAIGEGAGSTLPFLPLGVAGMPAASGVGALASGAEGYDEARRDIEGGQYRDDRGGLYNAGYGAAAENVARQAGQVSMAPGLSEAVPIELLLDQTVGRIPFFATPAGANMWQRGKKALYRVGSQVLAEGGQEGFQTWANNVINQIMVDPSQSDWEGVAEAAAVGAIVGGALQTSIEAGGAAGNLVSRGEPQPPPPPSGTGAPPPQPQTVNRAGKADAQRPVQRLSDVLPPGTPDPFRDAPPEGAAPWAPGAGPLRGDAAPPAAQPNLRPATPAEVRALDGEGTRVKPVRTVESEADLEAARLQVNAEPTEAQAAAGNYKKGHVRLQGFDIAVENPKGSTRRGKDPDGNEWESPPMPGDYGYIKGATASDGDKLDVLIGPDPKSQTVFVIDQNDLNTGEYDEAKVVMGAADADEAVTLYSGGFSDGRAEDRIGAVTQLTMDEFRSWVKSGDTRRPIGKKYQPARRSAPSLRPATPEEVKAIEAAPAETPSPDRAFDSYINTRKPLTPEAFARHAGISATEAGKALQKAAMAGRITQGRNGEWRRKRSFATPPNFLDWVSQWGVRDDGGELRGLDLPRMGRFGPVIRANGLSLDDLRERMIEDGFLDDRGWGSDRQQETTVADVLDVFDRHMSGKPVYSVYDKAEADENSQTRSAERQNTDW